VEEIMGSFRRRLTYRDSEFIHINILAKIESLQFNLHNLYYDNLDDHGHGFHPVKSKRTGTITWLPSLKSLMMASMSMMSIRSPKKQPLGKHRFIHVLQQLKQLLKAQNRL
jgi:hypothetical protein